MFGLPGSREIAEDRYQSALGLQHDLQICWTQLKETGEIATFEIGQWDISDRFNLPETLYGRASEVKTLLESFECFPGQLNQVFMNILANAIDALEELNPPQPIIHIRTVQVCDRQIVVHIADNSLGIPDTIQKSLFDPFFTRSSDTFGGLRHSCGGGKTN
jgi:signal transduction histidine kinase